MKANFIICLFFFNAISYGQVTFCHVGSEWNFLFTQAWQTPWASINENIKYNSYTLEGTDTVKFLNHSKFFSEINTGAIFVTSVKQKGDTIYMRNNFTNNQWQVLYNFGALAGQTWTNTFTNSDSYTTSVVATGTTLINSLTVKQLTVNYSALSGAKSYTYSDIITERYGSRRFLFNYMSRSQSDGDMVLEALCFKDNEIGLKQFSTKLCNYSNMVGIFRNNFTDGTIKVFPNPASDKVVVESDYAHLKPKKLTLSNALGQMVWISRKTEVESTRLEIDISLLPNGIYFLVAENQLGQSVLKVMKE